MTEEQFDLLILRFGANIEAWPEESRAAGQAFAETEEGQRIMMAEKLVLEAAGTPLSLGEDAFLNRLLDIPDKYPQQAGGRLGAFSRLVWALDLRDVLTRFFSPVGLVAQTACYGMLLVAGIYIGMSSAGSSADMELDLSNGLFASIDPLMMEGQ